jgi:uncharacterized protein (TIGR02145 family)
MIKLLKLKYLFGLALSILLTSCATSTTELLPEITTGIVSNVTDSSAICGGNVISDGGMPIIESGVCWNSMPELPTIKRNKTIDSTGLYSFTNTIYNLNSSRTYYVRAYATNENGTGYGSISLITTSPKPGDVNNILNPTLNYDSITDIEGNKYHTIKIGTQTWMVENLFVSKYRNGDDIPNETDNTKWTTLKTGAQSTYNNGVESNSIAKFGRLYNYYAVIDARNIAPSGWHVATDAEWETLRTYINEHLLTGESAAQALAATINWTESNTIGAIGCLDPNTYSSLNNTSGFSALPAGGRFDYGVSNNVGEYSAWWTSTQNDNENAWFRSLNYYGKVLNRNTYNKNYGLSVRCVKD